MFDGIGPEGCTLRSWKTSVEPTLYVSIFADEKVPIRILELS
jgi:hypothetical protein